MPNKTNFLEKALLVQVETTKVRRILNFENSFEELIQIASTSLKNHGKTWADVLIVFLMGVGVVLERFLGGF